MAEFLKAGQRFFILIHIQIWALVELYQIIIGLENISLLIK